MRRKKYNLVKENPTSFKKGFTPWNKGKTGLQTAWNKGKKGIYSEAQKEKIRAKVIDSMKYVPYEKLAYWKGKKMSEETRLKMSDSSSREKHWNWRGGISDLKYPSEFNSVLKERIKIRDNYTCQLCGITEEEHLAILNRRLCVNHIDFNKSNCSEDNLNTLCLACNVKINSNRDYWTDYFKQKTNAT
jgi:NUMOD3 motif-containing protein